MLRPIKLYGTTDGTTGAFTETSTVKVTGILKAVEWIDGDLVDGVDAVLSVVRDDNASDVTLLTLTNANADAMYYPRAALCDNTGAAISYDGSNGVYGPQIVNGKPKLAVTSGGTSKSGGMILYVED